MEKGPEKTQTMTMEYFGPCVGVLRIHATLDGIQLPPITPSVWFDDTRGATAGSRLTFIVYIKAWGDQPSEEISVWARDPAEATKILKEYGLISFAQRRLTGTWTGSPDYIRSRPLEGDGMAQTQARSIAGVLAAYFPQAS